MGCFNLTGFHTKLPICGGDEVFGIIGIYKTINKGNEFSPGKVFTPIALPIFGRYNEYGSIESIKKDKNTDLISEITGVDIEHLLTIIDDFFVGRYQCEEPYQKVLDKMKPYLLKHNFKYGDLLDFDEIKDNIIFIMDHKFFYDECIKSMGNFEKRFNDYLKETEEIREKILKREKLLQDISNKIDDIELKEETFELMTDIYSSSGKMTSLDPNIRNGYLYGNGYATYHNKECLMALYKDKNSALLLNKLKKDYCDFLKFFECFTCHSWILDIHNYCNQEDGTETLLPIYKRMVKHIENVIKKRKKDGWYDE